MTYCLPILKTNKLLNKNNGISQKIKPTVEDKDLRLDDITTDNSTSFFKST